MIPQLAAAVLAATLAAAPTTSKPPAVSTPEPYCGTLNQVAQEVIGADPDTPLVYKAVLFEASLAVANNMDVDAQPTHAQIVKAAADAEDCFPKS